MNICTAEGQVRFSLESGHSETQSVQSSIAVFRIADSSSSPTSWRTQSQSNPIPPIWLPFELMIGARKAAGLTQDDLARRLKKPQSFVAKQQGGERRLDVVEFLAITKAIGVDAVRIVKALQKRS